MSSGHNNNKAEALIDVWECEYCGQVHRTEQAAVRCEAICSQQQHHQNHQLQASTNETNNNNNRQQPVAAANQSQASHNNNMSHRQHEPENIPQAAVAADAAPNNPQQQPPQAQQQQQQPSEIIEIDDSSSDEDDDVIILDNVRQLASEEQLLSEPVSGLRVSGRSDDALLFEDLDQNDPVIQQQHQQQENNVSQQQQQKETATTSDDDNKEKDGTPVAAAAAVATTPETPSQPQPETETAAPAIESNAKSAKPPNDPTTAPPMEVVDRNNEPDDDEPMETKESVAAAAPADETMEMEEGEKNNPSQQERPSASPPAVDTAAATAATASNPTTSSSSATAAAATADDGNHENGQQQKQLTRDRGDDPLPPAADPSFLSAAEASPTRATAWDLFFDMLREFREAHHHTNIPQEQEGSPFYEWVANTRQNLGAKRLSGCLSAQEEERVAKLDALGFQWPTSSSITSSSGGCRHDESAGPNTTESDAPPPPMSEEKKWDDMYQVLVGFKETTGRVELKEGEHPELEAWLRMNKQSLGKKRLPDGSLAPDEADRMAKLEKLLGANWSLEKCTDNERASAEEADSSAVPNGDLHQDNNDDGMDVDNESDDSRSVQQDEDSIMRLIDEDITNEEEEALMFEIDRDIQKEEERRRKRPRFALDDHEDVWELDAAVSRTIPRQSRLLISNVEAPRQIKKLVPRCWNSRPFVDQDDIDELINECLPEGCISTRLDAIANDPNSWLLTIIINPSVDVNDCLAELKEWLQEKMQHRFNVQMLRESGEDISFDIGTGTTGAKLCSYKGNLMLTPKVGTNGETCTIVAAREALRRGGVYIEKVDGIACNTIRSFKRLKVACENEGRPLRIEGKQPNRSQPILATATDQPTSETDGGNSNNPSGRSNGNDRGRDVSRGAESSSAAGSERSRSDNAAGLNSFTHFKNKYKPVALIDYKGAGLHVNAVISSMWRQHKERFGSDCSRNCGCCREIDFLTKLVIRDNRENPKWDNDLGLKEGDEPVGFSRFFAGHFLELLSKEYPDANDEEILDRLLSMWKIHEETRIYGMKCSADCECVQGWEDVFRPAARKARADPVARPSAASRTQSDRAAPNSAFIPPAQRRASTANAPKASLLKAKEYEVSFDTNEPMGQYYENKTGDDSVSRCVVESLCLKTAKKRDNRIQSNTAVVAVVDRGGCRTPIQGWVNLKSCYYRAKDAGQPLRVIFRNQPQSPEEADTRVWRIRCYDDWTKNGKFRGKSTNGWAGGAYHTPTHTRQAAARSKEKVLGEKDQEANSSLCGADSFDSQWEKITLAPKYVQSKPVPKSIILGNRGPSDASRKISWDSSEKKEWQYEIDGPTNEFFAPRESKAQAVPHLEKSLSSAEQLKNDRKRQKEQQKHNLTRAVESGSVLDVLTMLDSGLASEADLTAIDLITLRESIADKEKTDTDFKMKNIILKVFLHALVAARHAEYLTNRFDFEVQVEAIKLNLSEESKKKSEKLTVVVKSTGQLYGRPGSETDLVEEKSFDRNEYVVFSNDGKKGIVRHTPKLDPHRYLQIELKRGKGEDSVLGILSLRLEKLLEVTRQNRRTTLKLPFNPSSTDLETGVVSLRVVRFTDTQKTKDIRKHWCAKVKECLGWIKRLNEDDLASQRITDHRLSYEVPIGGTSLLHTAVLLAEEPLVQRLLKLGARVNPSILSLAEGGREDGFNRESIVKLILQHKQMLELASQDESPDALDCWEIRSVDRAWFLKLVGTNKKECLDFNSGRCWRGRTCPDVHFYRDGKIPSQPPHFDESHVKMIPKENQYRVNWYTSAYVEGNELWIAQGAGGVQCEATGVCWYRDERRAREAARAAVEGYQRDRDSLTHLPELDMT